MIDYRKSKIYFIKRRDTDEVVYVGGTISDLKRCYWNQKNNPKCLFYKRARDLNLDWNNLKIEHILDYSGCQCRMALDFCSVVTEVYYQNGNEDLFNHFIENVNDYI